MGNEEIKMDLTEVYIIQYNDNSISKEGYSTLENAIKFINIRSYNPKPVRVLLYVDNQGNEYKILPINVK
jgi:hypothetical protein